MDGILCVDKPAGFTSFDVVAKVRGMAKTRKVGHSGTLDPMATGVLPLFLGGATKAVDLMPDHDKTYVATFRLGTATDTQDSTGRVLEEKEVPDWIGAAAVEEAMRAFQGEIDQLPPMYSAVKVKGQRLYDLARRGVEVERRPRRVTVHGMRLLAAEGRSFRMEVACSRGTYVRTICHDLGQALGCGAVMTSLRRTEACGFRLEECLTLEEAQAAVERGDLERRLLPLERAFAAMPRLELPAREAYLFCNGVRMEIDKLLQEIDKLLQEIDKPHQEIDKPIQELDKLPSGELASLEDGQDIGVFREDGAFLGVAYPKGGLLTSRRIFLREAGANVGNDEKKG